MKTTRRILAIILVILAITSCIGTAAFADNTKTVKQYGKLGGYIALGDSVARGVGATGDNDVETHDFYDRTVEGSYPYLVAQAVGCNIKDDAKDPDSNFWPVCFHGQTLAITMDLLGIDDGYYDEVYAHGNGKESYHYYSIMEDIYGNANEYLSNAGLITIGFGLSDVFYRAIVVAQINNDTINAEFVKDVVANIYEGYNYWVKAYPMLLKYIKENNPDATVVLVGNYNVGGDTPISDDVLLPVGMAATAVTGYMNSYLKNWANEYGYTYCDITNAETLAAQDDLGLLSMAGDNFSLAGHLSPAGNALVARNILNALPTEDGSQPKITTDIVVDLGRFDKVSYVMLDGKVLSNSSYSMNGYELTIPYRCKLAQNLTVVISNDNGKDSIYTYQLKYSADSGYKAYLICGIDDTSRIVKSTVSATSSIIKGAFGLFKK